MNPTEKLKYRLFFEKIFLNVQEIHKKDNKIICISYYGLSVWELYNNNLIFVLFINKEDENYNDILRRYLE